MNATRITIDDRGDFWVVVRGGDRVVVIGDAVWSIVVCVVTVGIGVGINGSRILNVVDPVTSIVVPDTFTIYSSGLNVDVSTSKDHRLKPFVPDSTLTVPADPENSDPCTFCVGLNDDEMISIIRLFPTARLVEPVMVNFSPI
jgi:hypothetical protein